jgi:hypothetical protein
LKCPDNSSENYLNYFTSCPIIIGELVAFKKFEFTEFFLALKEEL